MGLGIQKGLLEQVGAEVPVTYDEYESVLTDIYNTTGVQGALVYRNFFGQYFSGGFGTYARLTTNPDTNYPLFQIDGQVQFGPVSDGYQEYLATLSRWYANHLIYQDYYSFSNPNDLSTFILSGDAAVVMGSSTEFETYMETTDIEWTVMPDLVKERGDIIHTGSARMEEGDLGLGELQVVTTQCNDFDLVLSLYNFMYSDEGALIASYGQENVTFEYDENGEPQLTDLILNSDLGLQVATGVYLTTLSSVVDNSRTASTVTDFQLACYETWTSNQDDLYTLPTSSLSLTSDEALSIEEVSGDILTYTEEWNLKFITGALDVEKDYDEFVQTLESLGLQKIIDAYQSAYNRYLSR